MKRQGSTLPKRAADAKVEFSKRCARLTKFIREGRIEEIESEHGEIPDWAAKALYSAIQSIPLTKEMLDWDERSQAYVRGFMFAVISDTLVPLLAEVQEFAATAAAKNPSNLQLQLEHETVAKVHARLADGFRKTVGNHLLGDAKNDFLAGMDRWRKLRPADWRNELGNLATTPNLYLVAFWKEFAALTAVANS